MQKSVARAVVGLLMVVLTAGVAQSKAPDQLVNVEIDNRAEQDRVGKIVDLDERTRGFDLYGWADSEDLKELRRQGFSFELVSEHRDVQALTMCTDPNGPPFEPPATWDCYPTYSQYVDLMNYYATTYPNLCSLVDFGGTQDGDHRLLALKISDNVNVEEDEPEFFYTGTMHGDETTGYVLTLRLVDELLTLYPTDSEISGLVDEMVIWINPLANPDGTFAGGDNSVSGSQRTLSNGADPNRNFPDPTPPADDPDDGSWYTEVQAMIDLAQSENFIMAANFHGGAEVVNYPWDTWSIRHADDVWFDAVSHVYADNVQNDGPAGYFTDVSSDGVTNGYDWYQTNGSRQDYMNYYEGCREVTIELSSSKTLDSNLLDAHWGYNRQALLDFMKEVRYGIRGVVTDATSGDPVPATIKVVGHDSETYKTFSYCDPDIGDYHRPIEDGTWDLEFSAEGYETTIVSGIVATSGASTRRDVQMTALASYSISGVVTDVDTGTGIAGASVELTDTSLGAVVTNGSGAYTVQNVWGGAHTLAVSAPGYGAHEEQISVAEASTVFDVELASFQTVFDEDFESSDGAFTAGGTNPGGWQWGEDGDAGAASGTKTWGTVMDADYGTDNADWTLDTDSIELAADLASAQLEFSHWYSIENSWDGGHVQVSSDGGPFELVTPVGGYPDSEVDGLDDQPGFTGANGAWETVSIDLSSYVGHSIVVRFRFGTDSSQHDYRGWYLDDVRVLTTGGVVPDIPLFADGFESGDTSGWSTASP